MGLLGMILPMLLVIYEDFRYRAIHWIWIALFFGLVLWIYPVNWTYSALNLFFLSLQLALLTVYFSIKNQKWINLFSAYLGIGDVVFFIPLCFIFSPINQIIFFIISLSLSLIGFLVFNIFSVKKSATIPLAGCMSLVFILLILLSYFLNIPLNNDDWYLVMIK